MTINPSPEINVLIASYGDGELAVYDLVTTDLRYRVPEVYAQSLACSPDGRTLATGSSNGSIQIFDFGGADGERLAPVYRIDAYENVIRSVTFSNNSLRLVDIRGSQCRVWEPVVLARKDLNDGNQSEISQHSPTMAKSSRIQEGQEKAKITAFVCHNDGEYVFCGKQDGSIVTHRTLDGQESGFLYKHATNVAIRTIAWGGKKSILISADESGRIIIRKIVKSEDKWLPGEALADECFSESIRGMLISPSNEQVLVSGRNSDELWTMQGQNLGTRSAQEQESRRAICHPLNPKLLMILEFDAVHIFQWTDFKELTATGGIRINRSGKRKTSSPNAMLSISLHGDAVLTELGKVLGDHASARLECWQSSDIQADSVSIASLPGFGMLGPSIECIIAVTRTRLLYLDTAFWVCSLDLKTFPSTQQAKRHFFIPSEWLSSTANAMFQFTSKNEFVFVKGHELVIMKRGLDFSETVSLLKARSWTHS
jgi:hypothetical protein